MAGLAKLPDQPVPAFPRPKLEDGSVSHSTVWREKAFPSPRPKSDHPSLPRPLSNLPGGMH